ncbi:MAG: peptidoglycan-binding protein, partial [Albidovulum sp.]|nr:peptidoglycan-binding protein [Albidovulum sp.]
MPLIRRSGNRLTGTIWTGFVDAMTALLLVLIFVLTIFMIVQYILREAISNRDVELEELNIEVNELHKSISELQQSSDKMASEIADKDNLLTELRRAGAESEAEIAELAALSTRQSEIIVDYEATNAGLENQVAALLLEISRFRDENSDLDEQLATAQSEYESLAALFESSENENSRLVAESEALRTNLANARKQIAEGEHAARLAAAEREDLESLVEELKT